MMVRNVIWRHFIIVLFHMILTAGWLYDDNEGSATEWKLDRHWKFSLTGTSIPMIFLIFTDFCGDRRQNSRSILKLRIIAIHINWGRRSTRQDYMSHIVIKYEKPKDEKVERIIWLSYQIICLRAMWDSYFSVTMNMNMIGGKAKNPPGGNVKNVKNGIKYVATTAQKYLMLSNMFIVNIFPIMKS